MRKLWTILIATLAATQLAACMPVGDAEARRPRSRRFPTRPGALSPFAVVDGYYWAFDGIDERVTLPALMGAAEGDVTAVWRWRPALATNEATLNFFPSNDRLQYDSAAPGPRFRAYGTLIAGVVEPNEWHMVAIVKQGTTVEAFHVHRGDTGFVSDGTDTAASAIVDGSTGALLNPFFGPYDMSELATFTHALTLSELDECHNGGPDTWTDLSQHSIATDMVLWDRFGDDPSDDPTSNTGLRDQSGEGHHSILVDNMEAGDQLAKDW